MQSSKRRARITELKMQCLNRKLEYKAQRQRAQTHLHIFVDFFFSGWQWDNINQRTFTSDAVNRSKSYRRWNPWARHGVRFEWRWYDWFPRIFGNDETKKFRNRSDRSKILFQSLLFLANPNHILLEDFKTQLRCKI